MANNAMSILPLGGIGNVTKNMYVYEYEGQLLIIDCGLGFPEIGMTGVDLLIPDVAYLKERKDKIVGMVLTHGHDDHIGGLPYVLPQIGTTFPIYGSKLTIGFAQDRIKEFEVSASFREMPKDKFDLGPFTIEPIVMTHSVPDSRHIAVTTKAGTIYHGTDFKFDLNPVDGVRPDFQRIAAIGSRGVIALLSDSLNAEVPTFSLSESSLTDMFEREMRGVAGKVVITVMSSNLHRIQQIIRVARGYGRKVAFLGRSIENNIATATKLGFLDLPESSTIHKHKIKNFPAKKMCLVVAGSQGQEGSSLVRVAEGEHRLASISPEDKIIFASEAIPGNEINVYATIDTLSKTGADVHYSDLDTSVHVSGHSSSIEQKLLISLLKPRHVVPIGGTFHHMVQFRQLARSMGYKDDTIHLLENGQVIAFGDNKAWIPESLKLSTVSVTGDIISNLDDEAMKTRQEIGKNGMILISLLENSQRQTYSESVGIESWGVPLIDSHESEKEVIQDTVLGLIRDHSHSTSDNLTLHGSIIKQIGSLMFKQYSIRPVIKVIVVKS